MNLNDSNDGMVPLYPPASSQPPQPPPPQQYQPAPPKVYEKNIPKQQTTMDSTPIADIMQDSMDSQDPRAQQYMQNMMPPPMSAAAMGPPQQQKPQVAAASKNPLNLSDEQMRALVAGVCAIIAFSAPIQDKLSTTIPQFLTEAGSRSTTGLIATGLIAALIFYFAQRFLNK
jgi:hypothetical protein